MFRVVFRSLSLLSLPFASVSQVITTAAMDTVETATIGHVGLGGYVDSYYCYNYRRPSDSENPYFVSSAKNNEMTINLAYIEVKYRSAKMRARFTPGFGTYMDANYKNEPGSLKNMVEASVGVIISVKKRIWLDIGVMDSPYTNENAISKDQMMYMRSFAPENVPYYITGARLTVPVSKKVNAYFYVLNGWQVIQDNNNGKSIATELAYKPNGNLVLNWNTYVGDERSSDHPDYRTRIFNDFYCTYKPPGKFSASSSFYFGYQQRNSASTTSWWQVNLIGNYAFNSVLSLSGRIEHFNDPQGVLITTITGVPGFDAHSAGACLNIKMYKMALFRFEARQFFAQDKVYFDEHDNPTNVSTVLAGSLTAWF